MKPSLLESLRDTLYNLLTFKTKAKLENITVEGIPCEHDEKNKMVPVDELDERV